MSVTVNPCETNNCNFKGKWDKTEQGTPYYKTNSGTVAGAVLAVPAGLLHLSNAKAPANSEEYTNMMKKYTDSFTKMMSEAEKKEFEKEFEEGIKANKAQYDKMLEGTKRAKKYAIPFAITAAGLTLGCGMLVDHLRNTKAKEFADYTRQVGKKNAIMNGDKVNISNNGNPYYESNEGSKIGGLLGAGCGVVASFMNHGLKFKPQAIGTIGMFALGGWIMGKIADSNTNKNARKNA